MTKEAVSSNELTLQAYHLADDLNKAYQYLAKGEVSNAVQSIGNATKDLADIIGNISPTAKTLSKSIDLTNAIEEITTKANEVNRAQGFERFPAALSLAETFYGDAAIALELVAGELFISGELQASKEVALIGADCGALSVIAGLGVLTVRTSEDLIKFLESNVPAELNNGLTTPTPNGIGISGLVPVTSTSFADINQVTSTGSGTGFNLSSGIMPATLMQNGPQGSIEQLGNGGTVVSQGAYSSPSSALVTTTEQYYDTVTDSSGTVVYNSNGIINATKNSNSSGEENFISNPNGYNEATTVSSNGDTSQIINQSNGNQSTLYHDANGSHGSTQSLMNGQYTSSKYAVSGGVTSSTLYTLNPDGSTKTQTDNGLGLTQTVVTDTTGFSQVTDQTTTSGINAYFNKYSLYASGWMQRFFLRPMHGRIR